MQATKSFGLPSRLPLRSLRSRAYIECHRRRSMADREAFRATARTANFLLSSWTSVGSAQVQSIVRPRVECARAYHGHITSDGKILLCEEHGLQVKGRRRNLACWSPHSLVSKGRRSVRPFSCTRTGWLGWSEGHGVARWTVSFPSFRDRRPGFRLDRSTSPLLDLPIPFLSGWVWGWT